MVCSVWLSRLEEHRGVQVSGVMRGRVHREVSFCVEYRRAVERRVET